MNVRELLEENERLRSFLAFEARCPCCDTGDICLDGCTFAEDAPKEHERMMLVREILTPKVL